MARLSELNTSDVLTWFRSIRYTEREAIDGESLQYILHSVSIFRRLLEYAGGEKDQLQYGYFNQKYSARDNIGIYSQIISEAKGSSYIRKLTTDQVAAALSNSPLFRSITPEVLICYRSVLNERLSIGFQECYVIFSVLIRFHITNLAQGVPEEVLCAMSVKHVHGFQNEMLVPCSNLERAVLMM
jgi:hypothetical protein